ncbi:hypothetical protein CYMTET_25664 [Cymbomonas tetramitiformis]|uniref:Uncharacterized protein n=1 Tax=Cymbomonas tetramitiformis TaxID=36881 RepID=A0AAE0FTA8_9CHLO|nr:hypothetical protein CYMTET_25664 [Cymbomonas tetramitiformis]
MIHILASVLALTSVVSTAKQHGSVPGLDVGPQHVDYFLGSERTTFHPSSGGRQRALLHDITGLDCRGGHCSVDTGAEHSCARVDAGLRCWGKNELGQLGLETKNLTIGNTHESMPPPFVNVGGEVHALSTGYSHTCVVLESGEVRCWGLNFDGQLGVGHTRIVGGDPGDMPPLDVTVNGSAVQVSCGKAHTCVLLEEGEVRCWGNNEFGQLGYGHTRSLGDEPGEMPPPVVDLGGKVLQISAGQYFNCALMEGGDVRCWGDSRFGQTGNTSYISETAALARIERLSSDMIGDEPGERHPPQLVARHQLIAPSPASSGASLTCLVTFMGSRPSPVDSVFPILCVDVAALELCIATMQFHVIAFLRPAYHPSNGHSTSRAGVSPFQWS